MLMNMTGVPRLVVRLMMDRRVPLGTKLILPAAVAYLVLPIDIVPDVLPVGRIDDVLVLLISLALFLALAPKEVVSEHLRAGRSGGPPQGSDRDSKDDVIEGSYRVKKDEEERPR
jgi:uncharacterized membrane protein YkvA (DUF1232 family)